jgi:uncharacterized protein with GYD domain
MHYVILGKWTDQGIRKVKDSPKRVQTVRKMVEQAGGKIWVWYTMGEYDFVSIVEAPSDEVALKLVLTVGMAGNVRTTTMKATPETDMAKIIGQLR